MIVVTARVLRNIIEVRLDGERWEARPVGSAAPALSKKIAALFSTVYETYRSTEPDVVYSTVTYATKNDEIIIQVGAEKWRTRSSKFGPLTFEFGGKSYAIHEKITGKFAILQGEALVASGQLGFRSCEVHEYPSELTEFLGSLALGYLIRSLFWQMLR
jgi:hypothetical protein